ncbi:MAG: hypothetical protein ACMZI0_14145 [Symbiopectobacterium sp.]|uniref:hypothetical protein n=1 Tax=Symbiopectobacterium sp. TaxID=2952789 RepID=UPI0039EC527B
MKLVENNFSVWNIEYRRVGYIQKGYPEIFVDAINVLAPLSDKYPYLNLICAHYILPAILRAAI